ncbi:MAG: phage holin family protein [Verrucomicrobiota bacterium]
MKHPLWQLLVRWSVLALGVVIAAKIVPGISYDEPVTLLVAVLLLSFFNAVLRPLMVLFTLPFILMTMGLGLVLINALLFLLVGSLVQGFVVESFWSALGGALIVGITNVLISSLMKGPPPRGPRGGGRREPVSRGDVIDV